MSKENVIRTRYSTKGRLHCESGRPMHNEYQIKIDELGHKTLHKTGETCLQDKINAAYEETLISTVLERCQGLSEEEKQQALTKKIGQYVNLDELPQNLKEAQQAIINIKNEFYQLPTEVRAQFDNSPERYVQDYGTESWIKVLYPPKPEIVMPEEENKEVTTNE